MSESHKVNKTFEQFYEGFTNCRATQEGIKDKEISSRTKKSLDTYFRRAYTRIPTVTAAVKLPSPYNALMPLQDKTGKWNDLRAVLACLDMPEDSSLGQNLEEWEEATVFAIAAIRQRPELSDKLMEAHDLAFQWITSRGFITMAIEQIFCFKEPDYKRNYKASRDRSGLPAAHLSDFGASTVAPVIGDSSTSHMSTLLTGGSLDGKMSILVPEHEMENSFTHNVIVAPPLESALRTDTCGQELMYKEAQRATREQQAIVVRYASEFERVSAEVRRCSDRCIRSFQSAPTHEQRNQAFDELTFMLGPGLKPLPGVPDWRRYGAPSFRETCIDVLCAIQDLAMLRLDEEEARQSFQGRPAIIPAVPIELLDARWTFTWDGQDLVRRILHSLDWIQNNIYITKWYGRPFSFTANPFCLPMNLVDTFNLLGMEPKVQEQLDMKPFRRTLCGVDGPNSAWKQREYLIKWQPKFEQTCNTARLSTLWPITPDTVRYEAIERMHSALVVIFIKGRTTIMHSVGHEHTSSLNNSLKMAKLYTMKTALGPNGGKKSGKWRGTFDLSAGRDPSASANLVGSSSAGSQWRPLPKLKRRPTMPWPNDDPSIHSAVEGTIGADGTIVQDSHGGPTPIQVEVPIELHLTIQTSPTKETKKVKVKKTKKAKITEIAASEIIDFTGKKSKTVSLAPSRNQAVDSDADSSSTASNRRPESSKPKSQSLTRMQLNEEAAAELILHKKGKGAKNKNKNKGGRGTDSTTMPIPVPAKKKPSGLTKRSGLGSPSAEHGGRKVISRATFPTEIKLTRKVDNPTKQQVRE